MPHDRLRTYQGAVVLKGGCLAGLVGCWVAVLLLPLGQRGGPPFVSDVLLALPLVPPVVGLALGALLTAGCAAWRPRLLPLGPDGAVFLGSFLGGLIGAVFLVLGALVGAPVGAVVATVRTGKSNVAGGAAGGTLAGVMAGLFVGLLVGLVIGWFGAIGGGGNRHVTFSPKERVVIAAVGAVAGAVVLGVLAGTCGLLGALLGKVLVAVGWAGGEGAEGEG